MTVLGATGVVGQRFVRRLAFHPWFEVVHLAASERSVGRRYREACDWRLDGPPWGGLGERRLVAASPESAAASVVFSALDRDSAREIEPRFAAAGALVFSNAAAFRMTPEVPLLVPEVNSEHLALVERQRRARPGHGAIVCNPNCTATVLALALAPLERAFGVESVVMTSMQAVSGAGWPGTPSLDVLGNVVPFIRDEEGKVEAEIPKLFGRLGPEGVRPSTLAISALCHRVPVLDGHTAAVALRLSGAPAPDDVRAALADYRSEPQRLELPSAPAEPIVVHDGDDRPQARRDVETGGGMPVHVGRVRRCPVLGIKLVLLGHNTERGAAGGAVLNAELALALGAVPSSRRP